MKKTHRKALLILLTALLFTGCGGPAEDIKEGAIEETQQTESEQISTSGEVDDRFYQLYHEANALTDGLSCRQEQYLLYTLYENEDSTREDSIRMTTILRDCDTAAPLMSSVGTVGTAAELIDLELYYKDGMLYQCGGESKVKTSRSYEEAVDSFDLVHSFIEELTDDKIQSATGSVSADGTVLIDLVISGIINGMQTEGNGELLLNAEGLILSRSFSLSAVTFENGDPVTIHQSVESTLLSWNEDVPDIDFPALSLFTEGELE